MNRYRLNELHPPRFKFKEGDRVKYLEMGTPYGGKTATVMICDRDHNGEYVCVTWDGERDVCIGQPTYRFEYE